MSIVLQLILIALSLLFNFFVLYLVRRESLELKYALGWVFVGLALLLLCIFPNLLNRIAILMNVVVPINAAFFLAILFLMSMLLALTVVVSGHKGRIFRVTQQEAILEKKLAELEDRVARLEGENAALRKNKKETDK